MRGRGHTDCKSTQAPGVLRQRMPLLRGVAGDHEAHLNKGTLEPCCSALHMCTVRC